MVVSGRAGQFVGSGTLNNQGVLNSNGGGQWFIQQVQGVTNSGTIEATGASSTLYMNVAGLVNTGTSMR